MYNKTLVISLVLFRIGVPNQNDNLAGLTIPGYLAFSVVSFVSDVLHLNQPKPPSYTHELGTVSEGS